MAIPSTITATVETQSAETQEICRAIQQTAQGTTEVFAANILDMQRGTFQPASAEYYRLGSGRTCVLAIDLSRSPPSGEIKVF